MVSPIVATSLMMGILAFQATIALSMFPQWETPKPDERCFILHDNNATKEETAGCKHTPGEHDDFPPANQPPGCLYMKNGACISRDCQEILPDVWKCPNVL